MTSPPTPEHGPGDQPDRRSGLPAGVWAVPVDGRDSRLSAFGQGDAGDRFPPSGYLGMMLDELSGPDRRCPGATDDELLGLLHRWAAVESWAAAGKLGILGELTRRRARPGCASRRPAGLPAAWEEGTCHEVAAELAIAVPSADNLLALAVTLLARLPRIYAALAAGRIDYLKAKIIAEETEVLDDALVGQAEELILAGLAGKTPGMVGKLAAAAVVTVDPEGARKRREQAQRDLARVTFWRERTGTSALAGYGLPTDAALAATANIQARADAYKHAQLAATMDQLRVLAYLDILNGIPADTRIAQARAEQASQQAAAPSPPGPGDGPDPGTADDRPGSDDLRDHSGPGSDDSTVGGDDSPADGDSAAGDDDTAGNHGTAGNDGCAGGLGSDDGCADGSGGGPAGGSGDAPPAGQPAGPDVGPALAAKTNLTIPLATLLGLTGRPGKAHGLGPLDPALARDLAAAAARSPHSTWCLTITDPAGIAIGHGCATPARTRQPRGSPGKPGRTRQARGRHGEPARTMGANAPPPGRTGTWNLTPGDSTGPPGGYGTWTMTLPDGRDLTVDLLPIPVTDCDHRYETPGYQPNDLLRHLVQIRDGECTFPCCTRHARESDFEHAIPFDQGGRTCACNGGARSRRCHRVKQSKGWNVTQPRPGWHQWTTPSGRTYVQGPMKYSV